MDIEKIKESLIEAGFEVKRENDRKLIVSRDGYSLTWYFDSGFPRLFTELIKCGQQLKLWEIHRVLQTPNY